METLGRKLEEAEVVLLELYDKLNESGLEGRAMRVEMWSRKISDWRNDSHTRELRSK